MTENAASQTSGILEDNADPFSNNTDSSGNGDNSAKSCENEESSSEYDSDSDDVEDDDSDCEAFFEAVFEAGDKVYAVGDTHIVSGVRVLYGAEGVVKSAWSSYSWSNLHQELLPMVAFDDEPAVPMSPAALSLTPPPPIPGGYAADDVVYNWGYSQDGIEHGECGVVVGVGCSAKQLRLDFGKAIKDRCTGLCEYEPPPPLPAGFQLGETLFYLNYSLKREHCASLDHGMRVKVVGFKAVATATPRAIVYNSGSSTRSRSRRSRASDSETLTR